MGGGGGVRPSKGFCRAGKRYLFSRAGKQRPNFEGDMKT